MKVWTIDLYKMGYWMCKYKFKVDMKVDAVNCVELVHVSWKDQRRLFLNINWTHAIACKRDQLLLSFVQVLSFVSTVVNLSRCMVHTNIQVSRTKYIPFQESKRRLVWLHFNAIILLFWLIIRNLKVKITTNECMFHFLKETNYRWLDV